MFRRRVGDYLLGRTLGEGTTARVKYGVHAETGREVAVKVIPRSALAAAATAAGPASSWLTREIRILRKVHHPSIVELTDVLATKDKVCMRVMERGVVWGACVEGGKGRRIPFDLASSSSFHPSVIHTLPRTPSLSLSLPLSLFKHTLDLPRHGVCGRGRAV